MSGAGDRPGRGRPERQHHDGQDEQPGDNLKKSLQVVANNSKFNHDTPVKFRTVQISTASLSDCSLAEAVLKKSRTARWLRLPGVAAWICEKNQLVQKFGL